MPEFERPDGSRVRVPAKEVVRARRTGKNEIYEHPGHRGTALFKPKLLVLDAINDVGPALQRELTTFAMLRAPDSSPVWFDAAKVKDAEAPRQREASDRVGAVVIMGGVRQRVQESVSDAQWIIEEARSRAESPA